MPYKDKDVYNEYMRNYRKQHSTSKPVNRKPINPKLKKNLPEQNNLGVDKELLLEIIVRMKTFHFPKHHIKYMLELLQTK